jgi:putative transposase
MTARPRPRPDGDGGHQPNGAAAKAGLNKSILDAGWGIFLRILTAKAESAGRTVIAVNPRSKYLLVSRVCMRNVLLM